MRIYLASSWRNPLQPDVLRVLRDAGHEVYDFRNPTEDEHGFAWKDCDPESDRGRLTFNRYNAMVHHEIATHGFRRDADAMAWADTCVLLLPCGRSAHLELGWMAGQGKRTAVVFPPEPRTWDQIEVGTLVPGSGWVTEKSPGTNGQVYVTFDRRGDPFEDVWTAGHRGRELAPVALNRDTWRLVTDLGAVEPELMYRFCDLLTNDLDRLLAWLPASPLADDKLTVSRYGAIGEGSAGATAPSPALSDRRRYFAGDVDSYLAIFDWMKACGDTVALANEVQFRGPLMLWPGPNCGWEVARPGEWVERTDGGFVAIAAGAIADTLAQTLIAENADLRGVLSTLLHPTGCSSAQAADKARAVLDDVGAHDELRVEEKDDLTPCMELSGYHDEGDPMCCERGEGHDGDHYHSDVGSWPVGVEGPGFAQESDPPLPRSLLPTPDDPSTWERCPPPEVWEFYPRSDDPELRYISVATQLLQRGLLDGIQPGRVLAYLTDRYGHTGGTVPGEQ